MIPPQLGGMLIVIGIQIPVAGANKMNKTFRAFVLPFALFFTLSTVTAPARAALMLVPPLVVAVAGTAGTTQISAGMTAGVLVIGAALTAVILSSTQNPTAAQQQVILPGSRVKTPTPPGYTPPVSSSLEPNPPLVVSSVSMFQGMTSSGVGTGVYYSSLLDAANASLSWWCDISSHCNQVQATGATTVKGWNTDQLAWKTGTFQPTSTCPAGYSLVTGFCNLTTPSLVPLPSTESPTMRPTEGASPVLSPVPGSSPALIPTGVQTGVNPQNQPASKAVAPKPLPNGKTGSTITTATQLTDLNGATYTKKTVISTDENGVITDIVTSVLPTDLAGAVQTGANPSAGGAISFPTDYNREVTQQTMNARQVEELAEQKKVVENTQSIKEDMDADAYVLPAAEPKTPTEQAALENKKITDALDASGLDYQNFKLLDWSTWIPQLPAVGCSPFTGNVLGRPVSIDICPKIALLNELLGWLLSLWAAWSIISLMFRKD